MFLAHRPGTPGHTITSAEEADKAVWLDLITPTDTERAMVSALCGTPIPSRASLEEIESSSRLYTSENAVFLSSPLVRRSGEDFASFPLGFVLTQTRLITIRYADYNSFDITARHISEATSPMAPNEILVMLLEAIVERLADNLEHMGHILSRLSHDIFTGGRPSRGYLASWQKGILRRVGQAEDTASLIRDSLLGLDRIAIFLSDTQAEDIPGALVQRIGTVSRDIASLKDFVQQMSTKVQFLLDAVLGFISIEQNDGMKILTIVSFIGVAPTLIAGIYGMNFKDIPELSWRYGYWYCLTAMASSIIIPLIWFWRTGWMGRSE
ncbi:magnesium transporter CorA family protein [Acetobacter sp. AN02]|uniref:magnesium transporter CorA family protein n=1 Tax=Acetobacter sp. AN02 TaxID=2894186 RepID=UPI00243435E1|nr:magnesium transporter CorA family protein [Acetobacter sp. AN02]MDG6093510.1 magnesium transporter CorA family protein [Acetobacter sp. AN02]